MENPLKIPLRIHMQKWDIAVTGDVIERASILTLKRPSRKNYSTAQSMVR